jgi:hypothetical protein
MPSAYTNGLRPDQIDDLVELTLHEFEKDRWTDLTVDLQSYFAMDNLLLGQKVEVDGGDQLQWQVKVRNAGAAKNTGMYAVDDVRVIDTMRHAIIPWTMQTTNMAYDVYEEGFNSPDRNRIVNLILTRRHSAMTDFAELMENNFWGMPANTTDDAEVIKPRGVPYWIVRNATKGFNGGTPLGGGHSTVAGLNPTTYPRWKNWTAQYATISTRDLVRHMREAVAKCRFKPPVSYPSTTPQTPQYVIATTYTVKQRLEELLDDRNENLGRDVAVNDGKTLFHGTPITWVPWLDAHHDDTALISTNHYGKNPVYGINLGAFKMVVKSGAYMVRSAPIVAAQQHSVRHIHWDTWCQYKCVDRRGNFVLTQSA